MQIEEIDARTAPDEVLARFHELVVACHDELVPGEPVRSRDEVIAFYRHQPASHTSCHWLADGGMASLHVHGPTAAFLELVVDPSGAGAGSARLSSSMCSGAPSLSA